MAITPLPPAPEPTDSTGQFNAKAFSWVASLDDFTTEANALSVTVNNTAAAAANSATLAATSAGNAATQVTLAANQVTLAAAQATQAGTFANTALTHAQSAAAATNAPLWVTGTTYAVGSLVYSLVNGRIYRSKSAFTSTVNPALDPTNWVELLQVVDQSDIGTAPNEIPLNQYLGSMAYQNVESVVVDNLQVDGTLSGGAINGATIGATTASTGAFTNLSYTGTLTGSTGILNIGSGQIYKDASGNVGIGVSSPAASLTVTKQTATLSGTGNAYGVYVYPTSSGACFIDALTTGSSGSDLSLRQYNNGTYSTIIGTTSGGAATVFQTGGSERMRIDSTGRVLIGITSDGGAGGLSIRPDSTNGSTQLNWNRVTTGASSTVLVFRDGTTAVGNINHDNTSTTYATSSDYRLKENITDAPSAFDSIEAIQIRSFDWKVDGSHQKFGVIAQELEAIAPEAVSKGEKEDDMWGVDYSKLVPMMVKAIQELKAEIAILKGK
jgi:hypothetical protein